MVLAERDGEKQLLQVRNKKNRAKSYDIKRNKIHTIMHTKLYIHDTKTNKKKKN